MSGLKVYLLLVYNTATRETHVRKIFATEEKAIEYSEKNKAGPFDEYYIKEFNVE